VSAAAATEGSPGRRKLSVGRKLLLSLSVLVLGAALLEAAVRVRFYLSHGSWTALLGFTTHEVSGLPIPIPGRLAGPIEIDSLGFRNPELALPKPEGVMRLAFLGGSTTFCAEAAEGAHAWPARVRDLLAESYPETEFDFVNAGVSGYSIERSSLNLKHRVAQLDPDVIFIYHATNDITKDTRKLAQDAGVYQGHGDGGSFMAKYSQAWALIEKNLLFQKRMSALKDEGGRLEIVGDTVAADFEQRLTQLVQDAQACAQLVVLPTFSHQVRREQTAERRLDACNTSLYYMPYMSPDGCLIAFEAYNAAIRRVAAATGALLVEGEYDIPGDREHFNDSVHLIGPGLRLMGERVGRALIASPELKALL
jgi:lysophospholipase L1-like esterase